MEPHKGDTEPVSLTGYRLFFFGPVSFFFLALGAGLWHAHARQKGPIKSLPRARLGVRAFPKPSMHIRRACVGISKAYRVRLRPYTGVWPCVRVPCTRARSMCGKGMEGG